MRRGNTSLDELRTLWSLVHDSDDEADDSGYRPMITYAPTPAVSVAVDVGLRSAPASNEAPDLQELEGLLVVKGQMRYVSIRQGVMIIYSLKVRGFMFSAFITC